MKGGYRYVGIVVHEDDLFYHIDDAKTGKLTILRKDEVTTLEVIS